MDVKLSVSSQGVSVTCLPGAPIMKKKGHHFWPLLWPKVFGSSARQLEKKKKILLTDPLRDCNKKVAIWHFHTRSTNDSPFSARLFCSIVRQVKSAILHHVLSYIFSVSYCDFMWNFIIVQFFWKFLRVFAWKWRWY